MAGDIGAPEAGKRPKAWTRGHRERENLFDIALRTDTIIRLIIHKKNTCSKSLGASRNLSVLESRCSLISVD